MNSAILRKALKGNVENRITGEMFRRTGAKTQRKDWQYSMNGKEPNAADMTGGTTTICVIRKMEPSKCYEFKFTEWGDMMVRETSDWKWNP